MKRLELTGQKFGRLIVESLSTDKTKKGGSKWVCLCSCGKRKTISGICLKHGLTQSCGCYAIEVRSKINRKRLLGNTGLNKPDLEGKRFGKLIVLEYIYLNNKHKTRGWRCKCDCGNETNVRTNHLTRGKIQSCGCLREIKRKGNSKYYGDIPGRYWYSVTKVAKLRNIELNITIEDAWNVFLKQNKKCKLTGKILVFREFIKQEPNGKCIYSEGTASLDRIDSTKGYTIDNIQWLHKMVQEMKWDYNQKDFIEMCNLISEYNKKVIQ
jgi:hypothetical protein